MKRIWIAELLLSLCFALPAFAQDGADAGAESNVPGVQADAPSAQADAASEVQTDAASKPPVAKRMNDSYPHNTRRIPAGYLVGSTPTLDNIVQLKKSGIKVVLSLSYNTSNIQEIHDKIVEVGMTHLNVRMGRSFPKLGRFINTIKKYKPEQIYIHCEHGGDRTGAMLAFMLIYFQGWNPVEALLAVLNNNENDLTGLKMVFEEMGLSYTQEQIDNYMSIYSTGTGGLKGRNEDYRLMIRTTLEATKL